ncbi:MAG TPA: ester cyclase [Thermomicrobiaceae bacterium]|nr:ester cyclase [Thermomicrobiaceae bacterium]
MSNETSSATNKELARRFLEEIWSTNNYEEVIDEIIAPDFVFTLSANPFRVEGKEAFKQVVHRNRGAFPDLTYRMVDGVSEGDRVIVRWTMTATHEGTWVKFEPTGNKVAIKGMSYFRIADGQIAECDVQNQLLTMLIQIGAVADPWA